MIFQRKRQNGAVMVEFALVVFLFLMLVFGIIEFAFAIFQWARVVDATREGARAAIVNDVACPGHALSELCGDDGAPFSCTLDEDVDLAAPILVAMNRRNLGITDEDADLVTVTYRCSTAGSSGRIVPVPEVTVEVAWKHRFLLAGLTVSPDFLTVDLPSFATTRLGEDLHTPSPP